MQPFWIVMSVYVSIGVAFAIGIVCLNSRQGRDEWGAEMRRRPWPLLAMFCDVALTVVAWPVGVLHLARAVRIQREMDAIRSELYRLNARAMRMDEDRLDAVKKGGRKVTLPRKRSRVDGRSRSSAG